MRQLVWGGGRAVQYVQRDPQEGDKNFLLVEHNIPQQFSGEIGVSAALWLGEADLTDCLIRIQKYCSPHCQHTQTWQKPHKRPPRFSWQSLSCCSCRVASVVSDSVQPHRWQPIRFLCPWDSPGKNSGVGCHFLLQSLSYSFLLSQMVKNLPAMQKTRVQSLRQEDPLEKGMDTHSSILAWRIPWTEVPGGLQPMGSQRVGHDWATNTFPRKQLKFEASEVKQLHLTSQVQNCGSTPPLKQQVPPAWWERGACLRWSETWHLAKLAVHQDWARCSPPSCSYNL